MKPIALRIQEHSDLKLPGTNNPARGCKLRSTTHKQAELLNNLSNISGKVLGQTIVFHINAHHVFLCGKCDLPQHNLGSLMPLSYAATFLYVWCGMAVKCKLKTDSKVSPAEAS